MRVPRIDEVIRPVANRHFSRAVLHSRTIRPFGSPWELCKISGQTRYPDLSIKPAPLSVIDRASPFPFYGYSMQSVDAISRSIVHPDLFWYNGTAWLTGHQLAGLTIIRVLAGWLHGCIVDSHPEDVSELQRAILLTSTDRLISREVNAWVGDAWDGREIV